MNTLKKACVIYWKQEAWVIRTLSKWDPLTMKTWLTLLLCHILLLSRNYRNTDHFKWILCSFAKKMWKLKEQAQRRAATDRLAPNEDNDCWNEIFSCGSAGLFQIAMKSLFDTIGVIKKTMWKNQVNRTSSLWEIIMTVEMEFFRVVRLAFIGSPQKA